MSEAGYYRLPTIHGDTVVFVSEDDLWTIPSGGGVARRLTSGLGSAAHPALSPDGRWLAFSGREEGPPEVYLMPADGGQPRRVTYTGVECVVVGWTPDGRVLYSSIGGQPFMGLRRVFAVTPDGASTEMLPTGPATYLSFGPAAGDGNGQARGRVLARPSVDPAYWKRYRGGTAGDLWVDPAGQGDWRRLVQLEGNASRPLWVGDRVYFLCDHEGVGNLYSCTPGGNDLRRHSDHDDFYARHAATDGRRIVYDAAADLYLFDPQAQGGAAGPRKIRVDYHSPRTQRNRKFVDAGRYLESYAPHPQGHVLCLTTRGKVCTLGNWDGAARQHGDPCAGRYRLATWLHDGKRLVALSDDEGHETLTVHDAEGIDPPRRLEGLDLSRVVLLKASPAGDQVALSNVRNELLLVDLAGGAVRVLDRSGFAPIHGFDFSPDGNWVAYAWSGSIHTSVIKLCRLEDGQTFAVTRTVYQDVAPAFDPEGKYLYFLSRREFDPVYDNLHFDLGFPKGMRPYLVTLRKDVLSPFALAPRPFEEKKEEGKKDPGGGEGGEGVAKPQAAEAVHIELEGIEDRLLAFPVPEGIYQQIEGIKGKALFTSVPVEGSVKKSWIPDAEPPAKATLEAFDFAKGKAEALVKDITSFALSADRKTLVYRAGNRLRVVKAGEKPDEEAAKKEPGRESGWVDFKRLRVCVEPPAEWRQMYGEAWRLQREQYWVEDMADVDWPEVYQRYLPLLDRVSTRNEFSDLLWEMQGELGSSHAYAIGGDAREDPKIDLGFLGADLAWDEAAQGWRIEHVVRGDVWDVENAPPLLRPGVNVREGAAIFAVNGRRTSRLVSPAQLLVNQAGLEVALTVADAPGAAPRAVTVKTLKNETPLRYREWVERNRAWVHERTGGRCGYVHVPNMGPWGYAEFHRAFLAEVDREGLLVDVRFNGGGHVSALLLEKLARRRLAYVHSRWFGTQPWPDDAPPAAMVALTNEYAGSDGDIFSHNFKAMKLGPLLGKRTWGGVIGVWPRHTLVDGGLTTQPEFSFWFRDIGWKVENYGVDPDVEVEFRPQDYAAGEDPQMQRGLEELLKILEGSPAKVEFDTRPSRAWRKARRAGTEAPAAAEAPAASGG